MTLPRTATLARRALQAATDQVAFLALDLARSAADLLLEHHRDHVRRHGGRLECETCARAGAAIAATREHAGALIW